MKKKEKNITEISFERRGPSFVKEFKHYAASQKMAHELTFAAMNAFSDEEWKKFSDWAQCREWWGDYEDVVEWGFSENDISYYYPIEHFSHKDNPTSTEKRMIASITDAMETPEERVERMIFAGRAYCGICSSEPDDPEEWIRIDHCDHGCDHMEH